MILHVDACFLWENTKDSYRKSERLGEYVCKEVYMVVISLGEKCNLVVILPWMFQPIKSVHFGKLANHKIFLCYVSYLAKQTQEIVR